MDIKLKSSEEIAIMKEGGGILAAVMQQIIAVVDVGVRLDALNKLADKLIREAGAKPAFLNYKPGGARNPYQASICTSLNEVVVHGYPSEYALKSGDVLKLDFGVFYKNYYTDAAVTVIIGEFSSLAQKLTDATKEALVRAVKKCWPGNTLGDIGFEIEGIAKKSSFKVIKGLTGHGIGSKLHEDPVVYNFGEKGKGLKLKTGMVLAIEPMFSAGSNNVAQKKDESWATVDGSLAAHFEHTVAVTDEGPKILTEI